MYVFIDRSGGMRFPYSLDQLIRDNPDISFPSDIAAEMLETFGVYAVVSVGPPAVTDTQIAVQNGCVFNLETNRWETSWVTRDKTVDEMNSEIKDTISNLESSITPRRLREAILGVDGGWLENLNHKISGLRSQLK